MATGNRLSGIGALMSGLAGGALTGMAEKQEQDRKSQLEAAKTIFQIAVQTGDTGPLKLIDPKFMKTMGIGTEQLDALGMMLAPVRQERELRTRQGIAQTRKAEVETGAIEAKESAIAGLSPQQQTEVRVPELVESEVKRRQAASTEKTADASMMRAEKDLSFEQQLQLTREQIAGSLKAANIRAANSGGTNTEENREFKLVIEQFDEANKAMRQAEREMRTGAKDKKGGQYYYPDEAKANLAADMYNQSVDQYNQSAERVEQRTGQKIVRRPHATVTAVAASSYLGRLLNRTDGYTLTFQSQGGVTQPASAQPGASTQQTTPEIDEREKTRRKLQGLK